VDQLEGTGLEGFVSLLPTLRRRGGLNTCRHIGEAASSCTMVHTWLRTLLFFCILGSNATTQPKSALVNEPIYKTSRIAKESTRRRWVDFVPR
jgi:hypothetical protein